MILTRATAGPTSTRSTSFARPVKLRSAYYRGLFDVDSRPVRLSEPSTALRIVNASISLHPDLNPSPQFPSKKVQRVRQDRLLINLPKTCPLLPHGRR